MYVQYAMQCLEWLAFSAFEVGTALRGPPDPLFMDLLRPAAGAELERSYLSRQPELILKLRVVYGEVAIRPAGVQVVFGRTKYCIGHPEKLHVITF